MKEFLKIVLIKRILKIQRKNLTVSSLPITNISNNSFGPVYTLQYLWGTVKSRTA